MYSLLPIINSLMFKRDANSYCKEEMSSPFQLSCLKNQ